MKHDNALISEIAALCTVGICLMTFATFMVTVGAWEPGFWESSIIGSDGYWGEDIVVIYNDGTSESVKGISNNIWSTMSIHNDGSKPITMVQYCLNVKIPASESFDTQGYHCMISVIQNNNVFYQDIHTSVDIVSVKANEWTRIITASLDLQSISSDLNNGRYYTVSFENVGTIEGINIPDGQSIDIAVDDGIVRFLI